MLTALHVELLDLFRMYKPLIKDRYPTDPQMIELVNRIGAACGKIADYQRETETVR